MDYHLFDVDDFAADPFFIRWVKRPDNETNQFWNHWLSNHPEKSDTIAQAKSIVSFLHFKASNPSQEEQDEVKRQIMRRIQHGKLSSSANKKWLSPYAIAASLSLVLLGSFLLWFFFLQSPYQEYMTAFGEQQQVMLPDSTVVSLNANSTLRVPKEWQEHQAREVWLEGEAYFDVVKKPESEDGRFIVHTGELDVEVLGTTFNVQSRHGETQVVLNTGKVKLNQLHQKESEPSVYLEPGEMATLTQNKLEKKEVNPKVYSSWKDNRLFFENESIRSILLRIEDLYGYEVKVENSQWLDQKFTGSCPADDISILLLALSESFDFDARLEQQQILLQANESL